MNHRMQRGLLVVALSVISLLSSVTRVGSQLSTCNSTTEYKCSNSKCISMSKFNNSFNDCGDNSDEAPNPCRAPLYSCRNDRCVMMEWVLNGENDCIDMSDEVKVIGTPCHMAINCCFCHDFVANSDCHKGFCRCNTGYYSNQLGTECLPRLINSSCQSSTECQDAVPYSKCDRDTADDKVEVTDGSSSNYRCVCRYGYAPSSNGSRCVDLLTARNILITSVGVFVIGFLAILNSFLVVWLFKAFVCRGGDCYNRHRVEDGDSHLEQRRPRPTTFGQLIDVMRTDNRPTMTARHEQLVWSSSDRKPVEKSHVNGGNR